MKTKHIIFTVITILALSACSKEEDHYDSKNIKVDSVFDKKNDSDANDDKKADNKETKETIKKEDSNKKKQEDTNKKPTQNNQTNKKYITTESLNLRQEPSIDQDNIISTVDLGTNVEALEEVEKNGSIWVKIKYQDNTGYVIKDFLQEVQN